MVLNKPLRKHRGKLIDRTRCHLKTTRLGLATYDMVRP
jgi:hypothetical protein